MEKKYRLYSQRRRPWNYEGPITWIFDLPSKMAYSSVLRTQRSLLLNHVIDSELLVYSQEVNFQAICVKGRGSGSVVGIADQ